MTPHLQDVHGLTGEIPENLFENCVNAKNFSGTFWYCKGLTGNIPENLFVNNVNATAFSGGFGGGTRNPV